LPVVESKKPDPTVEAVAAVIAGDAGKLLFARRREGGLFGGLWEPPMVEGVSGAAPARPLFTALGLPLGRIKLREVGRVTHVLTHRRMEITVVAASGARVAPPAEMGSPYEKAAWLDASKPGVGVSTLARKVIRAATPEQKD
jgi:A/G-specific adenine glycosylase